MEKVNFRLQNLRIQQETENQEVELKAFVKFWNPGDRLNRSLENPHLYTLVTGACSHSSSVEIIRHIVN